MYYFSYVHLHNHSMALPLLGYFGDLWSCSMNRLARFKGGRLTPTPNYQIFSLFLPGGWFHALVLLWLLLLAFKLVPYG